MVLSGSVLSGFTEKVVLVQVHFEVDIALFILTFIYMHS